MEGLGVKVENLSDDEREKVNNEEELFLDAPIKFEYPVEPFEFKSCSNLEGSGLSPLSVVSHDIGSCSPVKQEKRQVLHDELQLLNAPSTSTHVLSLLPETSAHGGIPALKVYEENSQHQVNQRSSIAQKRPKKATQEVPCPASELELDHASGARPLSPNKFKKIISGTSRGSGTKKSAHTDVQNSLDWQLIEDTKKKAGSSLGGFVQNNSVTEDKFSGGESGDDEFEFEGEESPLHTNFNLNQTVLECVKTCPCQVCKALNNFDCDLIKNFLRTMSGMFSGDARQVYKQYLPLKSIPNKVSRVELTKNSGVYIPVEVKDQIKLKFHQHPNKMAMKILFELYGDEAFRTLPVTARGNKCGTYGIEPRVLAAVLGKGKRLTRSCNRNVKRGRIVKGKGKSTPLTRCIERQGEESETGRLCGDLEESCHGSETSTEDEIFGSEPPFVWSECNEPREPEVDPLECDSQNSNGHREASSETQAEDSTSNGEESQNSRSQAKEKRHSCPHCDKKFAHTSILNEHIRMHTGEKPYACSFCSKTFSRNSNLTRHLMMHAGQAKGKPYACSYCDEKYAQKGDLTEHIRTHTGENLKSCPYCEKTFPNSTALSEHVRTHSEEKPYSCPHCDARFRDQSELRQHIQTHRKNPHKCPQCDEKFVKKSHLADHIKTHTGEKPYPCLHCDKKFSHPSILTEHIRMHTGEKPYSCPLCYRKFSRNSNLSRHLQVHTDRSKEKLYDCEHCDKKFLRKGHLFEHNRMHNREKSYDCPHCGRRFSQSSALSQHVRTHSKEKTYTCPHCDKKFSCGPSFRSHVQVHLEKTFTCSTCGEKFARKSELAAHIRTHAGENSYSCPHCNKTFQFGFSLRLHVKTHHGEVRRPGVAMGIYMRSVVMNS